MCAYEPMVEAALDPRKKAPAPPPPPPVSPPPPQPFGPIFFYCFLRRCTRRFKHLA